MVLNDMAASSTTASDIPIMSLFRSALDNIRIDTLSVEISAPFWWRRLRSRSPLPLASHICSHMGSDMTSYLEAALLDARSAASLRASGP